MGLSLLTIIAVVVVVVVVVATCSWCLLCIRTYNHIIIYGPGLIVFSFQVVTVAGFWTLRVTTKLEANLYTNDKWLYLSCAALTDSSPAVVSLSPLSSHDGIPNSTTWLRLQQCQGIHSKCHVVWPFFGVATPWRTWQDKALVNPISFLIKVEDFHPEKMILRTWKHAIPTIKVDFW